MTFKVGDKVVQRGNEYKCKAGVVGVVSKVYEEYQYYRYDVAFDGSDLFWPYAGKELELVQ